jgi:cytochrome c oxidase subunit 2
MIRAVTAVIFSAGAVMAAGAALPRVGAAPPVHEIAVVAKNFSFEPAAIQVVAGEPVRLVLRSADVTHGFSVPDLKIDARIPRGGDAVVVEFTAPLAGRYEIACSEFCGRGHTQMKAALVSVAPSRTDR